MGGWQRWALVSQDGVAHPGGPEKRAIKWLWCGGGGTSIVTLMKSYLRFPINFKISDVKRFPVYRLSFIFLVLVFEFQKPIIVSNLALSSRLKGHTMCRSMVDIQSVTAEIRREKKERKKEEERKKKERRRKKEEERKKKKERRRHHRTKI